MQILSLIPTFFIFLYCLYKLTKDDYIFIRKNISLEQVFNVAFLTLFFSLLFARLLYFIFNPVAGKNVMLLFLSPRFGSFSLLGATIGGVIGLFIVGKYNKFPLGRIYDFFSLSFLCSLPFGFATLAIFLRKDALLLTLFNSSLYLLLLIFFFKLLYPKLMSRTMKEGNLVIFFLMSYSLISLLTSALQYFKNNVAYLNIQNILLVALFFLSIIFLIKQEVHFFGSRKNSSKK